MKGNAVCFALALLAPASYADVNPLPATPAAAHVSMHRSAHNAKAGYHLAVAHARLMAHQASGARTDFNPGKFLAHQNGRVVITATADVNHAVTELRADLIRIGLQQARTSGNTVSGYFPLARLRSALVLDSLHAIHAAQTPVTHAGSVLSEGDTALAADLARLSNGIDGSGVTVGVISDSFDRSTVVDLHAADDLASGDLPAVTVLSESDLCNGQLICIDEGRAMLQLIHDLAPGSDLMFHTVLPSTVAFANAIDTLTAAGADVIVDDVLYLNEPMFEDGIVAQAAEAAVASGVTYFSAAGNQGSESYESPFVNSGELLCIQFLPPYDDCDPLFERVGFMHDFDPGPGEAYFQDITIPVGSTLSLMFQWDEPWGSAQNDHIIVLLSHDGSQWITIAANDNVSTGEPWEVLQYTNAFGDFGGQQGNQFKLAFTYDDVDSTAPPAGLMKSVAFGGATIVSFANQKSALIGHANAANIAAVGAAYWGNTPVNGVSPPLLESFSSQGGTPILFVDGNRLPTPQIRNQPRFTAVDGTETTFFFNDTDGNNVPEFYGTSAAAPHAAAIAALMLQAQPAASPAQINSALSATAIDMSTPGVDPRSGAGLVQAHTAVDHLVTGAGAPPVAAFSSVTSGLTVTFTDESYDTDGSIMSWLWQFGDGAESTEQNPTHGYDLPGSYSVSLHVTDDQSNQQSTEQMVTVSDGTPANTPPTAAFSYQCNQTVCVFTDASTDADGDPLVWSWDFGDGGASTQQHPTHAFASPGNYTVTLEVSDAQGSDSAAASFRVKNRGSASGSTVDGGGSDAGGSEKGRKKCTDGVDNDGDGLVDGADSDC